MAQPYEHKATCLNPSLTQVLMSMPFVSQFSPLQYSQLQYSHLPRLRLILLYFAGLQKAGVILTVSRVCASGLVHFSEAQFPCLPIAGSRSYPTELLGGFNELMSL